MSICVLSEVPTAPLMPDSPLPGRALTNWVCAKPCTASGVTKHQMYVLNFTQWHPLTHHLGVRKALHRLGGVQHDHALNLGVPKRQPQPAGQASNEHGG